MPKTTKPASNMTKTEGVAAVNRALTLLQAFERAPDGLTLSMLAAATDLYESTILRLLDSLILAGFVKRLPDGRYVVGPKVLPLAEMYRQSFRLADYVLPRLRQLTMDSKECAGFYVREGERRVCLFHVQPQRLVRTHVLEGETFPLDQGAAGRLILALDEGTPGELYDQIRQHGYSVTSGERDPESAAIACPVFARGTNLIGAISLVIPLYRFSEDTLQHLLPLVQREANTLTRELGGISPYDHNTD